MGLLGGYFTLFAAGFGVTLLLMRTSPRINVIECFCLSWLLGVGIVSLIIWVCGLIVSGLALQILLAAICLMLGFLGWRTKQRSQIKFSLRRPNNRLEWILAAILLLQLATIFFVSLKHTLGWDGLLNWEIKARYAFLNGGVLPQSYYSNPARAFSHPEYPLAIPLTELWLYLWMGVPHQFWIKTIFPLFYISGALMLALFVSRLAGKRWLGLLVALLVPFVPFVLTSPGGITVGYVDLPLGVFYLAALGYLLISLGSNSRESWIIFAALLTLLPWIKSEGAILWSVLAVLSLLVALYQRRWRSAILSILPGLVLIVCWRVYLHAMHSVLPADFARPTFQLLSANIDRLATISRIALIEFTDTGLWSIFWLLLFVAIIYLAAARSFQKLILIVGIIGPLLLYLVTYIFSAWPSYTAHITSSLPRLLLQLMPVGWLAIGLALSPPKRSAESSAREY
ncbi:MAG TPA: hypothetical protein VH170_02325 [Chthoniobacterales bacterium]|nr:hypothetical protein [Chthoniobacterales bacterium]